MPMPPHLVEGKRKAAEARAAAQQQETSQPVTAPTPKSPEVKKDASQTMFQITEDTKKKLLSGPQKTFILPLGENEQEGAYETVQINGYRLVIKKGEEVTIPAPMYELIATKYRMQTQAGKAMRLDRNKEVTEALNG